jgi:hypothetical protein
MAVPSPDSPPPASAVISAEELHTTAAQRLRSAGLRYTSSRRAVVEVLAATDRPLTIPEISGQASGAVVRLPKPDQIGAASCTASSRVTSTATSSSPRT